MFFCKTDETATKFDSFVKGDEIGNRTDRNTSYWKPHFDTLLSWFKDPITPINLGLFYTSQPDYVEHYDDIYSSTVQQMLKDLDSFTAYIIDAVRAAGLENEMNIIFTADHGHANVYKDYSLIDFDQILDPKTYYWSEKSIFPNLQNG